MKTLKPKKIQKGDVIGLISPASTPDDLSKIEKSVKYFESLGYRVELGKNVGKTVGYLAGTDQERLNDLHDMFSNKNIKMIMAIRGGYGSARLLDKINYKLILKNPKIFIGYSDITALQLAFYTKCGLVTFAGPMAAVDFSEDVSSFAEENFWKIVTSSKKIGKLCNPEDEKFFVLQKGKASGILLGGNLAVMSGIIGSEYFPKFNNSILMLEDIGEPPYRIDRFLNQLKLMKIFKNINGVILGRFVDCYENNQEKKSLTLNEVISDYFGNQKFPVFYNFKHGHIKDNITVPFGLTYYMNSTSSTIEIKESAVS